MKVKKLSEIPRQRVSLETGSFDGAEHVTVQPLIDESEEISVNLVHFDHGAYTKMHIHKCDQILLVTKGKGFVETAQQRHELSQGDVVFAPKGEKHRHGGVGGNEFEHVSKPGFPLSQ